MALVPAAAIRAETAPPPASPPTATPPPDHVWTAEALDKLTARIALYPDALIAQILPAATIPLQVVEAARWLEAKKSVADGDKQEWDPSIKALLRYPPVLKMMNDDLRWTDELGLAFVAQPEDVLQSIQRLRRQAQALGNLKPTPRQRVIVDPDSMIVIAPPEAEPTMVYIPVYDPMMVFYEPPPPSGFWITFDVGFPLGVWIDTGIYWPSWRVVYGGWGYDWGWGDVYGGCCRGIVYSYTPTIHNRRLSIDRSRFWRPRQIGDRRRTPYMRSPTPPRPSADDISRGRFSPRTTPRTQTRTPTPKPGMTNIQRRPITERNVQRGRESLQRTPTLRRPETRTPPTRFTPRTPTTRSPTLRQPSFTPRTQRSSPSFTPRSRPDTQKYTTRGRESRSTVAPKSAPQKSAPQQRREAPKSSAPQRSPDSGRKR